jgi:hypothetical protein
MNLQPGGHSSPAEEKKQPPIETKQRGLFSKFHSETAGGLTGEFSTRRKCLVGENESTAASTANFNLGASVETHPIEVLLRQAIRIDRNSVARSETLPPFYWSVHRHLPKSDNGAQHDILARAFLGRYLSYIS